MVTGPRAEFFRVKGHGPTYGRFFLVDFLCFFICCHLFYVCVWPHKFEPFLIPFILSEVSSTDQNVRYLI